MRSVKGVCLLLLTLAACSPNNVKIENSLGRFFDEYHARGTFAIFDNGTGQFTVYNLKRYRDSAYLPASTFKIVNSLIGLQTGKISSDSMVIKWDGVKRSNPDWNRDLTMYDAFRVSAVPYYQEVARRIGKDTMQHWLDSLSYGTRKITGRIDSFWLDNSLKITPDEELGLVKKLYFNQLPFFDTYENMVKRAMLFEDNANYRLSYKTGTGNLENGDKLAWIVGWIEENKHPYFFVLNFQLPPGDVDIRAIRMKMLKGILAQLGFMQGKM
ncbi:MAG TPA: penicillin-binding transpeptidase domain-containing protein [Chitinophagaceae bacterium]